MVLTTEWNLKKDVMKPTDTASPSVKSANKFHFNGAFRRAEADLDMVNQAKVLNNSESVGMAGPITPDLVIQRDHWGFRSNRVTTKAVIAS